jgi:hypothetical protein
MIRTEIPIWDVGSQKGTVVVAGYRRLVIKAIPPPIIGELGGW